MGLMKALFGGDVKDVAKNIKEGVDEFHFSGEEKAAFDRDMMDLYIKYQEATQPQNVSRRVLALMVGGIWCLFAVLGAIYLIAKDTTQVKAILDFAGVFIMPPFVTIISFYFLKRMSLGKKEGK